jgi:hypothetical protein
MTLGEALEFLFQCHRGAPFLFFSGNTFGEIVRNGCRGINWQRAAILLCRGGRCGAGCGRNVRPRATRVVPFSSHSVLFSRPAFSAEQVLK